MKNIALSVVMLSVLFCISACSPQETDKISCYTGSSQSCVKIGKEYYDNKNYKEAYNYLKKQRKKMMPKHYCKLVQCIIMEMV